jgi:hypothetical protein
VSKFSSLAQPKNKFLLLLYLNLVHEFPPPIVEADKINTRNPPKIASRLYLYKGVEALALQFKNVLCLSARKTIPARSRRRIVNGPGLPDFSLSNVPKRWKMYQITTKLPNGHNINKMAVIYSKWP